MKQIAISLMVIFLFISCKNDPQNQSDQAPLVKVESAYPEALESVFKAHGGLSNWQSMNGLSFGMERPNGIETTLTNLKSRHSIIETPTYKLGFNGSALWVKELDTISYTGNAKFYNGLMFYFYAMPFVLADDGITYEERAPLSHNGVEYPGLLISYNDGVGASPEDQYIIYYHPETYQMAWLAYTVTFGKDEKSSNFRFIEYHDWQNLNGLKLPKAISWYKVEEGLPIERRNTLEFVDVDISPNAPDGVIFEPEENSNIIE
ncbi:DUF6503 family protein [Winogradskyella aurantiaca]|uniref:DUF6503 family protein n=1 Tax=Winogradskyella aurantiaca TaxID=2219558 RepID=UPI000E1D301F|nr:DUF6503 family protein [Winogradskyella aurantiaca]